MSPSLLGKEKSHMALNLVNTEDALSQNFTGRQIKVQCHGGETNPFNFTFHPVFTMYFLAGAIRCQCSNAGLQFVLVE
jgi:hypothetical protein